MRTLAAKHLSGAAAIAATWIGSLLAGQSLLIVLAALCALTLLLSIFLNNVATAIIMGPLAIAISRLLGVSPDAALLAVLIGASSDFLTPIGYQNNLLAMGPGGYRFSDYGRMGALLVLLGGRRGGGQSFAAPWLTVAIGNIDGAPRFLKRYPASRWCR